jgi:tetratricopeptide (TPR) repeat protein
MSFLRKKKKPDPNGLTHERYKTAFRWYQEKRLPGEETPAYVSGVKNSGFRLGLKKKNLLAWVNNPLYKYRDFMLEGSFSFAERNGYSAVGFLLRYGNEDNFYTFLMSSKGHFRFDLVFNGHPVHLIAWTPCPLIRKTRTELRVVAHGGHFSFYIDDEWVAEAEDETLGEGGFGLVGQNFAQKAEAEFFLHDLLVESRPPEVEKAYYRWARYVPVAPERRLALAKTYYAMARYTEAAIQLRRLLKQREGRAGEYLLLARTCLKLNLHAEALEYLEQSLAKKPRQNAAVREKADVLYLLNRFLEARDYIHAIRADHDGDPWLLNLLGNTEYALGNWESARAAYSGAVELAPELPLFRVNRGRVCERMNLGEEAFRDYMEAGRLLFQQQEYQELSLVLPRALNLNAGAGEPRALEAKMLFHEGKRHEAELILGELIEAGYQDSTVYYLYALILMEKGRRREADRYLQEAADLEPDYHLYWFRRAENRWLMGEEAGDLLVRALELKPDDPWTNNLYGQYLAQAGRPEDALARYEAALEAEPEAAEIYLNYSELLSQAGRGREALAAVSRGLRKAGEHAALFNQQGNLLVRRKHYAQAREAYEKALRLEPDNAGYRQNCLACCIELDMIKRSEELLSGLLDDAPGASVYMLAGNLAMVKREYRRAELAYREAVKLDGGNAETSLNLAGLLVEMERYSEALEILQSVLEQEPGQERALALQARVRRQNEITYTCAGCGRTWVVPKQLPPQPALKLRGEPPPQAPAGRCGDCGRLYCIACAADHVRDKRLHCPGCDGALKLSEDALKYLMLSCLEESAAPSGGSAPGVGPRPPSGGSA